MAITFEDVKGALQRATKAKAGEFKVALTRSAGPSSYSTGGFDVTVGELSTIVAALPIASDGYTAEVDYANSSGNTLKIKVNASAGTEVTGGTNLSGVYIYILAFGW